MTTASTKPRVSWLIGDTSQPETDDVSEMRDALCKLPAIDSIELLKKGKPLGLAGSRRHSDSFLRRY